MMARHAATRAALGACAGLVLCISTPSAAAVAGDDDLERCHARDTTVEIVGCLDEFTQQWDRKLNAAYQQALSAADADAGQRPQLQAAERAWLAFRQQNCGYYASVSGTIRQILGADCMARMTRDRAVELQDAIRP
jgi:uncharacterized protein YecT (DUF1311 family)